MHWQPRDGVSEMGFFKKDASAQPHSFRWPMDTVDRMIRFGKFEAGHGQIADDSSTIWTETQEPYFPLARDNPAEFTKLLGDAVLPIGGWACFGAARTAVNLLTPENRNGPSYDSILSASLEFLRASGVPPMKLTGIEWSHWLAQGGDVDSWIPRILPPPSSTPLTPFSVGEVRRVAQLGNAPDSNQLLVTLKDDGRYQALIDARWSDEDPTRSQSEWGGYWSESIYDLYLKIALNLQAPPFWYNAELLPFFPLPAPRI
jgi:hypothetical protein